MGLRSRLGTANGLQIGLREDARSTALHLLEVDAATDIAEEEEDLQGLDVGAGGDHVHSDCDTKVGRGTELGDEVFGFRGAAGLGVLCLVGDLLAEIIPSTKDLSDNMDDVLGV